MPKKPKKPKKITDLEIWKSIRKSWGDINPVTKIIPNKKKKSRAKNKSDFRKRLRDDI